MTPEQRTRADYEAEGRSLGLTPLDAEEFADACVNSLAGKAQTLSYALADLRAAALAPLADLVMPPLMRAAERVDALLSRTRRRG